MVVGDTISGPWPVEVFDLVDARGAKVVHGNADREVVAAQRPVRAACDLVCRPARKRPVGDRGHVADDARARGGGRRTNPRLPFDPELGRADLHEHHAGERSGRAVRRRRRGRRPLRAHAHAVRPAALERASGRQSWERRDCRTRAARGAYWALLGPDGRVPQERVRRRSGGGRGPRGAAHPSRSRSSRTSSIRPRLPRRRPTSSRCVARSYVREARRRGLGRRRERIGPIVERLAAEHADAQIALRFRSDLELLVSVMLSAQTTDTNVNRVTESSVPEVPEAGGLPRRSAGGARARHLRDRLLPPEGEGDPRDHAQAPRGVRRRGAEPPRGSRDSARCRAQDRERGRGRARRMRRASSSTRTFAASRSGSG